MFCGAVWNSSANPRRVVQLLRHDLAWRSIALQSVDEYEGCVGRDGHQVDAPTERCDRPIAEPEM